MTVREASLRSLLVMRDGSPTAAVSEGALALHSPEGYAALMAGDLGRVIRVVRQARGMEQAQLGHLAGASQTLVSRAERGLVTDTGVLTALCDALDILTPQPSDGDPAYSEDMRRRDLLRNIAAAVAAGMLPAAVADPARAGRIGSHEIEECWAALRRLQAMEDRQGGGTVYQLTAGIASHLQRAVSAASYDLATGRRLREVTAIAAVRAGWQAFDSSRRDSARRWWLEARHLADLGDGADEARVMALAAMAVPARESHRAHEAVGLARAAQRAAGTGAHPKLISLLAAREAIGHAGLGDTRQAAQCLATAHRWLDRGPADDAPAWLSFWGEGDLAVHEMHCAREMGDGDSAERAARAAVRASSPASALRNHSIYSAYLGHVLAAGGKLDESISVTRHVLKSDAIAGSQRVASEVRKTAALLAQRDYRPAHELAAHVDRLIPAA